MRYKQKGLKFAGMGLGRVRKSIMKLGTACLSLAIALLQLVSTPLQSRAQCLLKVELCPELSDKVQEILRSPSDSEMHRRSRALFQAAGAEDLQELKWHPNDGIALQVAWEEVLRTVAENESESIGRPGYVEVNERLGQKSYPAQQVVPLLCTALKDEYCDVRALAAMSLEAYGPKPRPLFRI
jgi:hypothetical protein